MAFSKAVYAIMYDDSAAHTEPMLGNAINGLSYSLKGMYAGACG